MLHRKIFPDYPSRFLMAFNQVVLTLILIDIENTLHVAYHVRPRIHRIPTLARRKGHGALNLGTTG